MYVTNISFCGRHQSYTSNSFTRKQINSFFMGGQTYAWQPRCCAFSASWMGMLNCCQEVLYQPNRFPRIEFPIEIALLIIIVQHCYHDHAHSTHKYHLMARLSASFKPFSRGVVFFVSFQACAFTLKFEYSAFLWHNDMGIKMANGKKGHHKHT